MVASLGNLARVSTSIRQEEALKYDLSGDGHEKSLHSLSVSLTRNPLYLFSPLKRQNDWVVILSLYDIYSRDSELLKRKEERHLHNLGDKITGESGSPFLVDLMDG